MADNQEQKQKEIRDKLNQEVRKQMTQRHFPWYQGMSLKGGAGSAIGYCAGVFAKQVSEILIWWAGLAGATLAALSYAKYITIHFDKIDADIFHLVAKAEEGGDQSLKAKAQRFVTHHMVLLGSLSGAFALGFGIKNPLM